jgi:hypothetical protein
MFYVKLGEHQENLQEKPITFFINYNEKKKKPAHMNVSLKIWLLIITPFYSIDVNMKHDESNLIRIWEIIFSSTFSFLLFFSL